jgi:hypothetical protein
MWYYVREYHNKHLHHLLHPIIISLMEQQFVGTYSCWNSNSHITEQLGYKHTHQILYPQKDCFALHFNKNMTRLSVGMLTTCQVFSVSCKTVYWWVRTNCCFVSDILNVVLYSMYSNVQSNCVTELKFSLYDVQYCFCSCMQRTKE